MSGRETVPAFPARVSEFSGCFYSIGIVDLKGDFYLSGFMRPATGVAFRKARVVDNGVRVIDNGVRVIDNGVRVIDNGVRVIDNGVRVIDNGVRVIDNGVRAVDDGGRVVNDGGRAVDDGGRAVDDGGRAVRNDGVGTLLLTGTGAERGEKETPGAISQQSPAKNKAKNP
jgi:hypothetical protein